MFPTVLEVSIPFIAGQWSLQPLVSHRKEEGNVFQSPSLRGSGRFKLSGWLTALLKAGFNPLHCGAVVASTLS